MKQLPPVYETRRERYQIDRCGPQQRAIQAGKIEFHALTKGHYPGRSVPANILPGLNSIGFLDAADMQDWGLDEHRNEGIEIDLLETGAMAFVVDGRQYDLRAGDFTVTRPWQLHKLGAPNIGPGRLHWLILDVGVRRPHQGWRWPDWVVLTQSDLATLTRKLRHNEKPVWPATPAVARAFGEVSGCVAAWDQPLAVSRMAAGLNQLLIAILEVLLQHVAREDTQLASRRRTVEMFLHELAAGRLDAAQPWTLDDMAKHCHMGQTAFAKYCCLLKNTRPMEFLNRCRLESAARLLRAGDMRSVTDIAFACGFNSSQYFATVFAKRFGTTPTQYRRRAAVS